MTITNTFMEIFYSVYSGENLPDDFKMALDRYFPENISQHDTTSYRELEKQHNRSYAAFSKAMINHLTPHLHALAKDENPTKEFVTFRRKIEEVYEQISKLGNFVSLQHLISLLGENRSLAGLFELGDYCGIARDFHVVFMNKQGFIVPNKITTDQLSNCLKSAKGAAKYFGSIYPFDELNALQYWDLVPQEHISRFSKELLSSDDDLLIFSNDYFGFRNFRANTILTQLIKIYSVYDETVDEHLEASLVRTLKKKITGTPSPKLKEPESRLEILNACSVYFIDYCLQMEWCELSDSRVFASPQLKAAIKKKRPEDKEQKKFYEIEKSLVTVLRKNGKPMHTSKFIPEMETIGANKAHEQEFSFLFYRKGTQYNSTYHTLDDCYEIESGEMNPVHQVDRIRVEISRISRNTALARKTKQVCKYQCQICGERIEIGENEFYAEAHHIQPLGIPHNGPDVQGNIICVCPNCHVKLDYGLILLDKTKLRNLEKNPVNEVYVSYHNEKRFNGKVNL